MVTDINGMRRVSPSQIDPWHGTYEEGARFSREQGLTLARMNLDHAQVDSHMVELECFVAFNEPPAILRYLCPVLQRAHRDTKKMLVITPGGEKRWVKTL